MIAGACRQELVAKFGDFTSKQAGARVQTLDIHSCSVEYVSEFLVNNKKNILIYTKIQFQVLKTFYCGKSAKK